MNNILAYLPLDAPARRRLAALLAAGAVASCALSPQTVTLVPELEASPHRAPTARTVALEVKDERGSLVIGQRGGLYSETSDITTEADIRPGIRDALSRALEERGYGVAAPGAPADVGLTVALEELEYAASGAPVVTEVNIRSVVAVTARKGGDTLTSSYRTTHKKKVAKPPSAADNAELINMTVSKSLSAALSDRELLDFLSQ